MGRAQRRALEIAGIARRKSTVVPVQLLNLSYEGCCLGTSTAFERGEHFLLIVPLLGRVAAEARWSHSGKVGVKFVAASD